MSALSDARRVAVLTGRGQLLGVRFAMLWLAAATVVVGGLGATGSLRYGLTIGVIFAIAILGNNAITGTLGEVNLGAGASVAVGAYGVTYLTSHGVGLLPSIVLAAGAAALVGAILAVPTVRLEGVFTALVTFALAFAIPDLILELDGITGGPSGAAAPFTPEVLGLAVGSSSAGLLILVVATFAVVATVSLLLFHGRIGERLLAIAEAGPAASSFGVRTTAWKVGVWTWAAGLGGLAGGLYAVAISFVTPSVFATTLSITLLIGGMAGGSRSVLGALLGGLLVGTLPSEIQSVVPADATDLVFGLLLFATLIMGGGGIGRFSERGVVAALGWRTR